MTYNSSTLSLWPLRFVTSLGPDFQYEKLSNYPTKFRLFMRMFNICRWTAAAAATERAPKMIVIIICTMYMFQGMAMVIKEPKHLISTYIKLGNLI